MPRKLFYQLTAKAVSGKVLLSFWQSTPVYHDKSMPAETVFTICRKPEPDFAFGQDYEEYFDSTQIEQAEVLYRGTLELFYKRRYFYTDDTVQVGMTYCYWVSVCGDTGHPPFGPCYVKVRDEAVWWSYAKINNTIDQLSAEFQGLVTVKEYGFTTMKKSLKGLIAGNSNHPIALIGTIHAGESGPELILPALRKLLENDSELLRKVGIAALPTVNADSRERLVLGEPQYIRTNPCGVDINRNFDADWNTVDYTYGYDTSQYGGQTYRGPFPNSEEETKAVIRFIEEVKPRAVLSFHCLASICDDSFYTASCAKEDDAYRQSCRKVVDLFKTGFRNKPCGADPGYICNDGSLPAYVYRKYGIPCFDLEFSGDEEGKCCLTDHTTKEVIELYQQRHYQGLWNLIKGLTE